MKATIITILVLGTIMLVGQAFVSKSTRDTEQHQYEVIKTFDTFEIRKYEPAIFSSVKLNAKSYKETSYKGFRILANYIFGENDRNEKIAMTSPVTMQIGDSSKMMFMVPKGYEVEDLPDPKNKNIVFEKQEEKIMAAIQFGGWANDEKIEYYKNLLAKELDKQNIAYSNTFCFLGYNPPYDVVDRLNEVVVELIDYK
jgi:hypothetical protein